MTKKWIGETTCDICKTDLTKEEYFVDAPIKNGPWALMCPTCYKTQGKMFGQKYAPDGTKMCDIHDA